MNNSRLATLLLLALGLLAVVSNSREEVEQDINQIEWWKKTNFYHIYLRSFKDSNGDGNGDLRGVIEKLDYLKQINVGTILMAPFYSSPMKDGGYDIDNYTDINPLFGTMQDFDDLVSELKSRSMRIVVDFVPNHSSNKHAWFECSERALAEPERCGKYRDYYVWSNSTRYQGRYPSNWISVFGGGTAWQWSDVRKEFYLHQFLPEQPDLNFTNPQVREEFKEIARFWLRRGADGLRVDSAIYLLEDTVEYRDEPVDPNWREGEDPYYRLSHKYTKALSESATIVKDWRQVCDEPEFAGMAKIIITEAYDEIPKLIEYYGPSPGDHYAELPFNFQLMQLNEQNLNASSMRQQARSWIQPTRNLSWPDQHGAMAPWIIWVNGNHDNKRLVNRVGSEARALALKWYSYLLPGVPVNYYGDEIPLHDLNYNRIPEKTIAEGESTRLVERGPIAWTDAEPSGGFSNTSDIWLPLATDYKTNNVGSLLSASSGTAKNHLKLHLQLEHIRQTYMSIFVFGDLVFYQNLPAESDVVFAMARVHERFGNLLMLVNFDQDNKTIVRLSSAQSEIRHRLYEPPKRATLLMTNADDAPVDGTEVELEGFVLAGAQVALFLY